MYSNLDIFDNVIYIYIQEFDDFKDDIGDINDNDIRDINLNDEIDDENVNEIEEESNVKRDIFILDQTRMQIQSGSKSPSALSSIKKEDLIIQRTKLNSIKEHTKKRISMRQVFDFMEINGFYRNEEIYNIKDMNDIDDI